MKNSITLYLTYAVLFFLMACNFQPKDPQTTSELDTTQAQIQSDTTSSIDHAANAGTDIIIGTQTWMPHNLDVTVFRNGDKIPAFKNYEEWSRLSNKKTPAFSTYDNNEKNASKYGRLYNWYAVNDKRGLCPQGYKVPSKEDFETLITYLNHQKPGKESTEDLLTGKNSAFNAVYGGWCCMDYTDDEGTVYTWVNINENGPLWTSTPSFDETDEEESAWNLDIGSSWRTDSKGVFFDPYSSKEIAFAVRCIKE